MRSAVTVPAELPLEAVLQLMAEEQSRMVLVVNADDDLIGTLRADDVERVLEEEPELDAEVQELRALIGDGFRLESALCASEVMEPYVQVVRPSCPADRALALMRAEGVAMLPVVVEGDSQAIGVVHLADLEPTCTAIVAAVSRTEPHGTFRDITRLPAVYGERSRLSLIDLAERLARSWLGTRPVGPNDAGGVTFTEVMLPLLSDLYDGLVDHYSDFQESDLFTEVLEVRPELWGRADRLRRRQGEALALVSAVLRRVRHERRPDRECLRRIASMTEELRSIEEAETDLVYEAHYVDVAAVD